MQPQLTVHLLPQISVVLFVDDKSKADRKRRPMDGKGLRSLMQTVRQGRRAARQYRRSCMSDAGSAHISTTVVSRARSTERLFDQDFAQYHIFSAMYAKIMILRFFL
jgi:hypothetical protein